MKKISKILSSVLAASLALSCMAMNVMAASKSHALTITPDKTKGLKAGDTVTIELTVDNTEALVSFQYELAYDATAFVADTTKVNRLEKYIDKTWLDGMKDTDGDWGYYLGNPTYSAKDGKITFAWAGSEGVEADYAVDNRVVGKFYLTVADGVADGEYTFSLVGKSMDAGETLPTAATCVPVTVKVGEDAPNLPADRSEAVMFKANQNTYVKITKGEEVKNFFLPTKVDGEATVYGLFKYTVDGTNVAKNDVFTIKAIDAVTKAEADVATVTVK